MPETINRDPQSGLKADRSFRARASDGSLSWLDNAGVDPVDSADELGKEYRDMFDIVSGSSMMMVKPASDRQSTVLPYYRKDQMQKIIDYFSVVMQIAMVGIGWYFLYKRIINVQSRSIAKVMVGSEKKFLDQGYHLLPFITGIFEGRHLQSSDVIQSRDGGPAIINVDAGVVQFVQVQNQILVLTSG